MHVKLLAECLHVENTQTVAVKCKVFSCNNIMEIMLVVPQGRAKLKIVRGRFLNREKKKENNAGKMNL